jgi:hypothetical protein
MEAESVETAVACPPTDIRSPVDQAIAGRVTIAQLAAAYDMTEAWVLPNPQT